MKSKARDKILMSSLYSSLGGSHKVMHEASLVLKQEGFNVDCRGFTDFSDSVPLRGFSHNSQGLLFSNVASMVLILIQEFLYCIRHRPKYIYVHDIMSFYAYVPCMLLGCKIIRHVHSFSSSNIKESIREYLSYRNIYINENQYKDSARKKVNFLIENPVILNVRNLNSCEDYIVCPASYDEKNKQNDRIFELSKLLHKERFICCGSILDEKFYFKMKSFEDHQVTIYGPKSQQFIYSRAKAVVSFSKYETFGLTMAESLLIGIPFFSLKNDAYIRMAERVGYPIERVSFNCVNEMAKYIGSLDYSDTIKEEFTVKIKENFGSEIFKYKLIKLFSGLCHAK